MIDTNNASICWFRGETVIALWEDASGIMGKHCMGGQSQARFQRGHEEQVKQWLRIVADKANQIFLSLDINKMLVAGPALLKHRLVDDGRLDYRFTILGYVDCGYVDPIVGAREALSRWNDKP